MSSPSESSEFCTAPLAEFCIAVVPFATAGGAGFAGCFFNPCAGHYFGSHNARGHGNDAVADEHDKRRNEFSQRRYRRNVAIAYGSQGNDGPVDAVRDTLETVFPPFH